MTAIVGILNKRAVAVATDSAVTIDCQSGHKVLNSAIEPMNIGIPSPGAYIKMLPQSSYILTTLGQLQFYKSLYITIIPTFSHIISDVQSAKFNKNSDEYHARTYIYSDEKRKTAHHNLTINPSSILLGQHILHLPYDMHIVQRLKS